MRIGFGYDAHRLTEGRDLILGGVKIPFEKGLDGHSDADVLIHAIIDAILGAASYGDIGYNFPDDDSRYKNIDSTELLKKTEILMLKSGYKIGNIDSTIIAQEPKLIKYIPKMKKNISKILGIDIYDINIKATTEEKMGFTGRKEGIAAHAVVLLIRG